MLKLMTTQDNDYNELNYCLLLLLAREQSGWRKATLQCTGQLLNAPDRSKNLGRPNDK